MPTFHRRHRTTPSSRLAARLYAYAFCDDLILLYPFYTLLFADTGLTTAQISALLATWSVTAVVVEIPSGVLADVVSRRLLLTIGPLLAAAGFTGWLLVPSWPGFALGFVLWGCHGALQSGALEALVYEELDRYGAADRYPRLMGRARATRTVSVVLAIGLAGPVFAAGGYVAVGAASVLACLVCAAVAAGFPEHRDRVDENEPADQAYPFRSFGATLRAGLLELRSRPALLAAALLLAAVTAIWGALDEYLELLARDTGVASRDVPWLILPVYLGTAVGGLLAARAARLSTGGFGALLAAGGIALGAGAASGRVGGFALIAVAFAVFQVAETLADARLQRGIAGRARSTITSVAGFAAELFTIAIFAGYAAGSLVAGHAALFVVGAGGYLVVASWLIRSGRARDPLDAPVPGPAPGRDGAGSRRSPFAPPSERGTG